MTEIGLPDSVIEAGVFVYKDVLRRNWPFTSEEFVEEMFTAMATALVKHDREHGPYDPTQPWDKFTGVKYIKACYEAQEARKAAQLEATKKSTFAYAESVIASLGATGERKQ